MLTQPFLHSVAKINGIEKDLGISQAQFNLALSIFQVGYGLFQIPSNLFIVQPWMHPGVYLSVTCLAWSTLAMCHAFVRNYTQLLTVRFLLGVFDAPYFVGATFLLSCWYTKREMAMRLAIMLVSLIFMLTFLGPIAAGIIEGLDGVNGWRGWRWVYLIFGCCGLIIASWGFVMLPGCRLDATRRSAGGSGRKVRWLTQEQFEFARLRIEKDRVGEQTVGKNGIWNGIKAAVSDKRVWVFMVMMMSRKSFEGLWNYELSIYKSLRLIKDSSLSKTTLALVLSVGPATFAGLVTLTLARSSDRNSERSFHMMGPLLFAAAALIVCAATMQPVVRYAMFFFIEAGELSGLAMAWAWVTSSVQETPEKKAVAIAIVNVLGGTGAIYGPFFFKRKDAPGYRMALGLLAGFAIVDVACIMVIRRLLQKMNRALREDARVEGMQDEVRLYAL